MSIKYEPASEPLHISVEYLLWLLQKTVDASNPEAGPHAKHLPTIYRYPLTPFYMP